MYVFSDQFDKVMKMVTGRTLKKHHNKKNPRTTKNKNLNSGPL